MGGYVAVCYGRALRRCLNTFLTLKRGSYRHRQELNWPDVRYWALNCLDAKWPVWQLPEPMQPRFPRLAQQSLNT